MSYVTIIAIHPQREKKNSTKKKKNIIKGTLTALLNQTFQMFQVSSIKQQKHWNSQRKPFN